MEENIGEEDGKVKMTWTKCLSKVFVLDLKQASK